MNAIDTDARRRAGEQIYLDGTSMREGDLCEVEPTRDAYNRPKHWIHGQGWIVALNRSQVVLKSTNDGKTMDFHPADLTLISRAEDE